PDTLPDTWSVSRTTGSTSKPAKRALISATAWLYGESGHSSDVPGCTSPSCRWSPVHAASRVIAIKTRQVTNDRAGVAEKKLMKLKTRYSTSSLWARVRTTSSTLRGGGQKESSRNVRTMAVTTRVSDHRPQT